MEKGKGKGGRMRKGGRNVGVYFTALGRELHLAEY